MSVTFAGTTVSISAVLPATYDQAGFAALTFTAIGEVTTAPGSGGKTYEDVSYTTLADRATKHLKGTSDQAEQTLEIVVDRADAGQALAVAALDSDNEYAMKVEYNNGEVDYANVLVTGYEGAGGDSNTIRTATMTFRRNFQGTVEVAAP